MIWPRALPSWFVLFLALGFAPTATSAQEPSRKSEPVLAGTWSWQWSGPDGETHRHVLVVAGEAPKYAASWLLVHYLFHGEGGALAGPFVRYIKADLEGKGGADVLYERRLIPLVVGVLRAMLSPDGFALVSGPYRVATEDLEPALASAGLRFTSSPITSIDESGRPLRGTLHRIWKHSP